MAELAAAEAETGAPSVEISVALSKYYLSFREPRRTFDLDNRLCTGPRSSRVTVVEFSDFECPYCAAARPMLEEFARQNASTVRLCFAPFPLSSHPHAKIAAAAALFARDHGKFWPMHDRLFEIQARLGEQAIGEVGKELGLSAAELSQAMGSDAYDQELKTWRQAGEAAGVDSTPALYINGRRHTLGFSAKTLRRALDDEMEWVEHTNSWAAD